VSDKERKERNYSIDIRKHNIRRVQYHYPYSIVYGHVIILFVVEITTYLLLVACHMYMYRTLIQRPTRQLLSSDYNISCGFTEQGESSGYGRILFKCSLAARSIVL
jgi:hypothetical protein